MLISEFFKIPVVIALSVVGGILALSIFLSLVLPDKKMRSS
jgi:hypothetical protein